MHAVIFEVWPKDESRQEYLDIAAALKPTLEKMDGFISIERFQSLTDPSKILSLSFWRDDAAIAGWRQVESHRMAQRDLPRLSPADRRGDPRLRDAGTRRSAARQPRPPRLTASL
jgi:heme-degrading monooxygenase HmoA